MRSVLAWKNMPLRWPIGLSWLLYLTLDIYNAPGWLWGMAITLVIILFAGVMYDKMNSNIIELKPKSVMLLGEEDESNKVQPSVYRQ